MKDPIKHRFTHSRDIRLHYVEKGQGETILFLHGFPEFWYAWKNQLNELGRTYRVIAPDLRGYGRSDKPKRVADYRLEVLIDDISAMIAEVGDGEKLTLVGHDWGGILAWYVAMKDPALLKNLVILNAPHPAIFRRELFSNPLQTLASGYTLFFQIPWLAEQALRVFDFALLRRMVFGSARDRVAFTAEDRRAYREAWRTPGALEGSLNYYRANGLTLGREPRFPQITVPTKVLWGQQDPALRPSNLHGLERYVHDLEITLVPNATHWIAHERPDLVNGAIREFLSRRLAA